MTPPSQPYSNNVKLFPISPHALPVPPWLNPCSLALALVRRRLNPGHRRPRNSGFSTSRHCVEHLRLGLGRPLRQRLPRLRAVSVRRLVGCRCAAAGPRRRPHRATSGAGPHLGSKALDFELATTTLQPPVRPNLNRLPSRPSTCLHLLPRRGPRRPPPQSRSDARQPRAMHATCKRTLTPRLSRI